MIRVNKWNMKESRFESVCYLVPSFVIDETAFGLMVQAEHIQSTNEGLDAKMESAAKAFAKASDAAAKDPSDENKVALEKASKRNLDAIAAAAAFDKAVEVEYPEGHEVHDVEVDVWAGFFCIASGLEGASISVESFEKLYKAACGYIGRWHGSQVWSDDRKADYKTIKDGLNAYIERFAADVSEEVYKPFTPEFSSEAVNRFFAKATPIVRKSVVKTEAGDIAGFTVSADPAAACFRYALSELFYKYGCRNDKPAKAGKVRRWNF